MRESLAAIKKSGYERKVTIRSHRTSISVVNDSVRGTKPFHLGMNEALCDGHVCTGLVSVIQSMR